MPVSLLYAFRNVLARKGSTAVTMLGVLVSVLVFVLMSATAKGIDRIADSTGSPRNVLVLADGAASAEVSYLDAPLIQRIQLLPGVERDSSGEAVASVELLLGRAIRLDPIETPDNVGRYITYRGVTPRAFRVHDKVRMVSGRFPSGAGEVLAGNLLARKLGLRIGSEVYLESEPLRVCGILEAPGQVFAGELWADLGRLQSELGRTGASTVVLRAESQRSAGELLEALESATNLPVDARAEPAYYRDIQSLSTPFASVAAFVGLILGLGAVLAGTNTLYAAMSRRTRELGTLRALGFGRWFVGGTVLLESVLVSLLGGCLGLAVAFSMDGFALNLVGLSFELVIDRSSAAAGLWLSLLIGVAGGALPARSALRLRIIEALRHA